MIVSSPDSAVNQPHVDYATVHEAFIRLVLQAARHPNRAYLRDLTDALLPLRDEDKLANLRRIEAAMEAKK